MNDPFEYPDQPGFKVAGASAEAAHAMERTASTLRSLVLKTIAATPQGLTADEIADRLNRSPLSVRPRVAELYRLGEIRQTGQRGRNASGMTANRWVVSPPLQSDGTCHE